MRVLFWILTVVLACLIASAIGWVASWLLAQFGVHVGWLVCAVAFQFLRLLGQSIFVK